MKTYFKNIFTLDLRSLALFRVLIGVLLISDCLARVPNLLALYSDAGIVTRADLFAHLEMPFRMSLLSLNGSWVWSLCVALLGLFSGAALVLGWKTRIQVLVGWLVLCAFHARNPLVAHGGDNLLRMLFFWSLFLPLGQRWSWDSSSLKASKQSEEFFDFFGAALVFQLFCIYVFTSIYKLDPAWTSRFDALYYAAELDAYLTRPGEWMQGHLSFLKVSCFFAMLLEAFGVLLFFIPWKQNFFRFLAVLLFVLFHAAIGMTFRVGIFSTACIAIWCAMLPASFWDYLAKKKISVPWPAIFSNRRPGESITPNFYWMAPRFLRNLSASILMMVIFAWNVEGLNLIKSFVIKSPVDEFVFALQLNQQWNMFAPSPMKNDGWFILAADLGTGERVDLLDRGAGVSEQKPLHMADRYPDSQWRKFLLNLRNQDNEYFRGRLANFYCKQWNEGHIGAGRGLNQPAIKVELIFMQERSLEPEFRQNQKIEAQFLWTKTCD